MHRESPRGRSLPTSKHVAALAGVSQSTVSYVMSGKRAVSDDVRNRVEQAMKTLSYHPNQGARALRGVGTNVIALVVNLGSDSDSSDSIPYVEAVVDEARDRDYDVVLVTHDEGPGGLDRLAGRRVADAFLLMDVRTEDPRLQTAAGLGMPVVLFGRPMDRHGLDAVDFDTRKAAALLVDELAETGHRHVVVVSDQSEADAHEMRFVDDFNEGARQRASDHGLAFDIVHRGKAGWAGIAASADRILTHQADRLGLIARTPRVTDWLVQLTRLRGLVLGKDLSLVSLCTNRVAQGFEPAVTNVSPQPRGLSRLAMQVLFERIEGDDRPARLELMQPEALVRRDTTAQF